MRGRLSTGYGGLPHRGGAVCLATLWSVCTTGNPAIVSGSRRRHVAQKTDAPLACLSRRSIVSAAEGVYYSSEDGLVLVGLPACKSSLLS
jgi:hypothetical protein